METAMKRKLELVEGEVYQVKGNVEWGKTSDWVIAKYKLSKEAISESVGTTFDTFEELARGKGRKTVTKFPPYHLFSPITARQQGVVVAIKNERTNIRPVTEETKRQIAEMKSNIERLRNELAAVSKEFDDFCGGR